MPEVADSAAASGIDRKERFRQFFRAFNPTASPAQALADGFVVNDLRPELFHKKIAARVELEPRSRQAIIGGIGSGKTTELLLVSKHLAEQGITAFVIEVSRFGDISKAKPGFLIGIAAKQLLEALGPLDSLLSESKLINNFLYGYWLHDSEREYDGPEPGDEYYSYIGGVVAKPILPLTQFDEKALQAFERIAVEFRRTAQFALLIDGLDRTQDMVEFRRLAMADLGFFQSLEIPVVCVAPLGLQFEPQSDLREQFDRIHELGSIRNSGTSLRRALEVRDSQSLIAGPASIVIEMGSGGNMRDLITLARDAGEEAYVSGSAQINKIQAEAAVRHMGISYSRGLSHRQLEVLLAIRNGGGIDPTDPEIMQLLATRRIVEYSSTSFAVHPALSKVLRSNDSPFSGL